MEHASSPEHTNLKIYMEQLKDQLRFATAQEERHELIDQVVAIAQVLAKHDKEHQEERRTA